MYKLKILLYCVGFLKMSVKMKIFLKTLTLSLIMQLLFGCASQSAKMAHKINNNNDKSSFTDRTSDDCIKSIAKTNTEDYVFNGRMIATPLIGVLGLFTAPLILAANVSLDVKDRLVASEMSKNCGGNGIKNKKIAQDVVVNGTLGLLLQGTNLSVYPGGEEVPVSTAAEAASN